MITVLNSSVTHHLSKLKYPVDKLRYHLQQQLRSTAMARTKSHAKESYSMPPNKRRRTDTAVAEAQGSLEAKPNEII